MKFTSNPLSGVSVQGKNIVGADGQSLLKRHGVAWDENDQIGYDLLMKSMDYRYQSDLLNYQNEYNSPEQQAIRMRQAGINPDLVGTANNPSATSSASAPSTQLKGGDVVARNIGIAKDFINVIPQAFQIYEQMRSLGQTSSLRDIEILKGIQSIGDSEVSRQFTLDDLKSAVSMPQADLTHINNKKLRRRVDDYIFSLVSDASNRDYAQSLVYDKKRSAESNRQGFLKLLGEFGYNIDDKLFVDVLREFNDVIFGEKKSVSKYNKSYHDSLDGSQQAATENKQLEKAEKVAENDMMAELMKRANKKFDSGDAKEQIIGAIMFIGLSLIQNSSFGVSSGPKGRSMNFGF